MTSWTKVPAAYVAGRFGSARAEQVGQVSWAMFEWARNPYYILIWIYIFGPYFTNEVVDNPVDGQVYWLRMNWIGSFLIAMIAPFLGAFVDSVGHRKPWILLTVGFSAPLLFALWWALPDAQGLSVLTIATMIIFMNLALEFSAIFHNAMLAHIARGQVMARLSGLGLALGNGGALIILTVMLFAFALPGHVDWPIVASEPLFGIDPDKFEPSRMAGPVVAVWIVLFTLPLLFFTPDQDASGVPLRQAARASGAKLMGTLRKLRHYKNITLYLCARMLYNDGKTAVLIVGGVYASSIFSWGFEAMTIYGLVLTIFAISGGILGGWLDNTFGSRNAILISIGGTTLSLLAAVSITPAEMFFIFPVDPDAARLWAFPFFNTVPEITYLGVVIFAAIFITAAYANSRTMLARIVPESMMAEFFGLYALSGTATAFIGTLMVERITDIFNSQRIGFGSILILLIAGFVMMFWVREERAEVQ